MLSVSEAYSQAVASDFRDMPYRVRLMGAVVLDRSKVSHMTLEESISGNSGVELGTSNSATLKLTIRDADPIDYNDILVEPESGIVLPDGSIEWVPLGRFWVTDSNTSNDYKTLNLTCADGMYHMSGEYVSKLTYPTTIKAVVAEIVAQAGVEFKGMDTLPDIPVRKRVENTTHRVAIGYAAGCCGCNARFDRYGRLEFVWYTDTGVTIDRRLQYLDGMVKLNNRSLDVGFEITGRKETYKVTTISDGNGSVTAVPGQNVEEGEEVVVSVNQFKGYELATLIALTDRGEEVTLYRTTECGYSFIQPDSNVTVTASFRTDLEGPFNLTLRAYDNGSIEKNVDNDVFLMGDTASFIVSPDSGYEIDKFVTTPANLSLIETGNGIYEFTFPQSDVTINVYFKEYDDSEPTTPYSWLQKPPSPPTYKPYWAMFYRDDENLPTSQKYYLIWFDSWSATLYGTAYDINEYKIQFDGYYYCGSRNNGNGKQEWDNSVWTGNGDPTSNVKWNSYLGFMWSGTDGGYIDKQWCLVASNADLYRNGTKIFEANSEVITDRQTGYLKDGMDIREKGSLSYWMCPDTFSTPLPSPNWMVLMPYDGLYMILGEDGCYQTNISSYPASKIVMFYDNISIQSLGVMEESSAETLYLVSVTNGRWAYLRSDNLGWDTLHALPEGAVFGLRNPLNSTYPRYIYQDGNEYCFSGLLATNRTLYAGNDVVMYNNACRICNCVTENVVMFSMRRSVVPEDAIVLDDMEATGEGDAIVMSGRIARSDGDAIVLIPIAPPEKVTMTYTNPMIYEKMIPYISSVVQGVSYTPAKIKHRGNPALQAGDIVKAPDKDGLLHTILIMQQKMTFGGGMNSEITCPGQTEKTKSFSSNSQSNTQLKQEILQSNEDLEHKIATSNALVYSSIYKNISSSEAQIKSVVEWQTEAVAALSQIEQTVSDNSASINMVVKTNGEEKSVRADIIMEAINNDESEITIRADKIFLDGKVRADDISITDLHTLNATISGMKINEDGLRFVFEDESLSEYRETFFGKDSFLYKRTNSYIRWNEVSGAPTDLEFEILSFPGIQESSSTNKHSFKIGAENGLSYGELKGDWSFVGTDGRMVTMNEIIELIHSLK